MRAKEFTSKLKEGWESGPDDRERPEPDPDWGYEQRRQEKLDREREEELERTHQAKLTYKLLGRGPKMEPNYDFGMAEFDSREAALAARERLMADPDTPNPKYIGIQTIKRYAPKSNVSEAETPLRDLEDYQAKRKALQDLQRQANLDDETKQELVRRMASLEKQRQALGEEKDACYHKVKSRYKVWPSAYASGALSKCRKVGAKNWGNKSKK